MKPLGSYAWIKGVNYRIRQDEAVTLKELGYAKRLGINSVRVWLSYEAFEREGEAYIRQVKRFVQVCHGQEVTVVPILFNGNGLDPAILEADFAPRGERFASAVVEALRDEPGLLMYDVMNEPPCNDLILRAPDEAVKQARYEKIWAFVRHYCAYVKRLDPVNAVTVGNWLAVDIESSADLVDVLSYHDYSPTLKGVRAMAELALSVGRKYGKPVINNETCCIARANPYDQVIQTLDEYGVPWYVFNLMIDGYWKDVHGIFYPDGTVRDPAVAAAIVGCFRNRRLETLVPEKPNREQEGVKALKKLEALLADSHPDVFAYGGFDVDALLDVCETIAHLLEGGQLVPMQIPPTARIDAWRRQEQPDVLEIKRFAYDLAQTLKRSCQIL